MENSSQSSSGVPHLKTQRTQRLMELQISETNDQVVEVGMLRCLMRKKKEYLEKQRMARQQKKAAKNLDMPG
jgi:hypothetical protein